MQFARYFVSSDTKFCILALHMADELMNHIKEPIIVACDFNSDPKNDQDGSISQPKSHTFVPPRFPSATCFKQSEILQKFSLENYNQISICPPPCYLIHLETRGDPRSVNPGSNIISIGRCFVVLNT